MSNSFTDFFETLLPREITLYVIPGSLVLSIVIWATDFKPNKVFLEKISLEPTQPTQSISVIVYIFYGAIWLAAAYLIGLIVGGIKQGLHREIESWEDHLVNRRTKPRSKSRNRDKFIQVSLREEYEESGSQPLYRREDVSMLTQDFNDDRIEKPILPLPSEHLLKEDHGKFAMYLAIREEKMYRREIERYGVFKEALENITISLIIVGIIVGIYFLKNNVWLVVILELILFMIALLLLLGAHGYKELQKFRIKTMFKALKEKELKEKEKWEITRQTIDKQQPSSEDSKKYW